jgi:CheY-like chemotaxis protein
VAKILVADDNSNIQKMVVLALKDQGIEVVAVGNGEAAVRKISDLKPDLVLADIFMPVRNGYEVCKFVKDDSALSHIPVILLVGAFDPLDEQEASRVGADGVLKKPFVPPDPLISMVKAALARAGVSLGAPAPASTSTPPPPMPTATKPQPPPVVPVPKIASLAPVLVQDREEDLGAPVFSGPRPAPLTIAAGTQPLAFGSLLETATPDDDAVFAVSSSSHTAPDRDWGNSASTEEEEEPEETSKTGSWRISSAIEEAASETPAGQTDWREAAFSGIGSEKSHSVGWAPSIEKNSLAITQEEAAELARKDDVLPAISSSHVPENWHKAIEALLPSIPQPVKEEPVEQSVVEARFVEASAVASRPDEPFVAPPPPPPAISEVAIPEVTLREVALPEAEVAEAPPTAQPETSRNVNSWMAGSVSPWEAELERASQLASTWETAKAAPDASVEENSTTEADLGSDISRTSYEPAVEQPVVAAEPPEEPLLPASLPASIAEDLPAIESLLSPETKEILHEETSHAVAGQQPEMHDLTESLAAVANEPVPTATPNMDEIVAKVLAKMNPEVLQAVTREILKPLVEAMIKDELSKK